MTLNSTPSLHFNTALANSPSQRNRGTTSFPGKPKERTIDTSQAAEEFLHNKDNNAHSLWPVTEKNIQQVPYFYPLEKGTLFLEHVSVTDLVLRIVNFLRRNSVHAHYEASVASLEGETQDHVKFVLKLWLDKNQIHKEGPQHGTMVEMTRLDGCSVHYMKLRRCLIAAIKGEKERESVNDCLTRPVSFRTRNKADLGDDEDVIDSPLRVIVEMMKHKHLETREMGVQALCSLTDPTITDHHTIVVTAKAVVLGTDECGREARKLLFSILLERNTDHDKEGAMATIRRHLRNGAVRSASHCLAQVLDNQTLITKFRADSTIVDTWISLVPSLVDDLDLASTRPHDAYFSEVCLSILINLSKGAQTCAVENGILPALSKAHEYGKWNYLALEQESLNLLASLAPKA